MVVPPKHPKIFIFSRKTHGCWVPPFKETPISWALVPGKNISGWWCLVPQKSALAHTLHEENFADLQFCAPKRGPFFAINQPFFRACAWCMLRPLGWPFSQFFSDGTWKWWLRSSEVSSRVLFSDVLKMLHFGKVTNFGRLGWGWHFSTQIYSNLQP